MLSIIRRIALVLVAAVALLGGAFAVQNYAIQRLLHDDATVTATAWATFVAANSGNIGAIAAGAPPSPETRAFIGRVKTVARVFLYKIYDKTGRIRFVSDDRPEGPTDDEDLDEHNAEALEAVEAGRAAIEVKTGAPPSRPAYYSEAYVPVLDTSGAVVAVVETYIDQAEKQAEFQSVLFVAAAAIGTLLALAAGVPGLAWYSRKRKSDRADERLAFLTDFDALSRLANRTHLMDGLKRALVVNGPSRTLLGLHCIDINRFKDINDTLGLSTGDAVLKVVADRLRALAAPTDLVARLGGDEFVLVQRAPRDRLAVEDMATKIDHAMSSPIRLKDNDIMASVSIGLALAPEHGRDPDGLLRNAELALVKAKAERRSRICVYTPDLDKELRERVRLERAIDEALASDAFELHYQPLCSEPYEILQGFEALARLPDGKGGYIPPIDFIAAAERMGAINRLGAWVLRRACAAATAWPAHLTVSVNLSVAQFDAGSVTTLVRDALATTGLAPERLLIEITESVLVKDGTAVLIELTKLKALGARIVMDDFGTGYSSLNYLWRFPFDKIKIDGSFMRAFDAPDAPAAKIVGTIATLGHALGMTVCVEGVETASQAAYARALGCDEVQGYYFGRPALETDVAAIVLADFRKTAGRDEAPHADARSA